MKKYLTFLLLLSVGAVSFFGCVDCTTEEPVDTNFFSHGDTIVLKGVVNGETNTVTGAMLLAVAEGLATGEFFDEDATGIGLIIYKKYPLGGYLDTLWWPDFAVTASHGIDTVAFVTTYQSVGQVAYAAILSGHLHKNCSGVGTGISGDKIAFDVYTGSDTAQYNDYVRVVWNISIDTLLQSSHVRVLDSCLSTIAVGLALDTAPQVYGVLFVYNNADSVLVSSTYEINHNNDTTLCWVTWLSQDTLRSAANDTLYDMYLEREDGAWQMQDSLDRYMGTGNSATEYMTLYIYRETGL